MPFPWEAVGSIASGVAGALFDDSDEAERQQRALWDEARGLYGDALDANDAAELASLQDLDMANEVLAGIEPAILAGLDDQLRVMVAQRVRENEAQDAELRSRMASAGLDATTAMAGVQRTQRLGQANQIGALSAGYAGQRANAIAGARGAYAQGLANRGGMVAQFGQNRANILQNQAGFVGGLQVQPSNRGALIGNAIGSVFNGFGAYQDRVAGQATAQQNTALYERYLNALGGAS